MEALLTTIGLLVVIALALALLARSWPRSSRGGGYRAWSGGEEGRESREPGDAGQHGRVPGRGPARPRHEDEEPHWPTGE